MDRLVQRIKSELSSQADGYDTERNKKLKEDLRELLSHTEFEMKKERSLELYVATSQDGSQEIVVLGRELPLYRGTTVEDVGMRKDPWINEMVKLRNIKKILVDKDILFTRATDTVDILQQRGLLLLNLKYTQNDIFAIRDEGLDALRRQDAEGVLDILELLFELTGYKEVRSGFVKKGQKTYGKPKGETDISGYTNIIMVDCSHGHVKAMFGDFIRTSTAASELFAQVSKGLQEPDMADADVLEFLVKEILGH
jgi:hypothetical protein